MKRSTPGTGTSPARQLNALLAPLGGGNQGRFVRLGSADTLDRREIEALLAAAIDEGETPLPRSGCGYIVIKSVSPRQRPRRVS